MCIYYYFLPSSNVCICKIYFSSHIDVYCSKKADLNKVLSSTNIMAHEHIYNLKTPTFFFCKEHAHKHKTYPAIDCVIQTIRCCSKAIHVKEYDECFSVTTTTLPSTTNKKNTAKKRKQNHVGNSNSRSIRYNLNSSSGTGDFVSLQNPIKSAEYIIFDPSIWREQSYNHFMSFIRAVVASPNVAAERYKRYESSNFSISNIKKYKSGKESIIRTAVTGFETKGLYQTSTISCLIPYYTVVLPQKLYDILDKANYDLDLVLTKRDPSLLQTCMYVNAVIRNTNPTDEVIKISDQQSKGFNQDQDGDKNAIYPKLRVINGYDATQSYKYKISKMELAAAFRSKATLITLPRYLLSETSLLLIERHQKELSQVTNENSRVFFTRTHPHGIRFMNEASAGYLRDEYDDFQKTLIELNKTKQMEFVTIDDILLKTTKLSSIITSQAKGNKDLLDMLLMNISSNTTLSNCKKSMIDLCNKYIVSSQDLSRNGRKQFTALYAAQDLISFNGNIYINKIFYANYMKFASVGLFLFNEASLELFLEDLINL